MVARLHFGVAATYLEVHNSLRQSWTALALLLLAIMIIGEFHPPVSGDTSPTHTTPNEMANKTPFKVHLNTKTSWSTGGYSHAAMAEAAQSAGYNAIFFADNARQFLATNTLADPSFEDIGPNNSLTWWRTGTLGTTSLLAIADPVTAPALPSNYNESQWKSWDFIRERVRSGNSSLHLEEQSNSASPRTDGFAFARPIFPNAHQFSGTSGPGAALLINSPSLSGYAFIDQMGYLGAKNKFAYEDNVWFYLRFTISSGAQRGPTAGQKLTLTVVWSDHPADDFLRSIRHQLNETGSKVIYQNVTQQGQWMHFDVNVTGLVKQLWNETIVREWRLDTFEIGVRSRNNALISVYVDDISLNAAQLQLGNLREYIESELSTPNFRAYVGYSLESPRLPAMYVYGTDYFDSSVEYNLTDPGFWARTTSQVYSDGGIVILGSLSPFIDDYVIANLAFGEKIIDGSDFSGLLVGRQLLKNGNPIVFAAIAPALRPQDFNSSETFSLRVFASTNSEKDILNAISEGKAYLAISNFTGNFEVKPFGLRAEMGGPIYIPAKENASLSVSFDGLQVPGNVYVYQSGRLDEILKHDGSASLNVSHFMRNDVSRFFTVVTEGVNDSIALASNPLTFIQAQIIPDGALYMDNSHWSLGTSEWTSQQTSQRLNLTVNGPAGTSTVLYLYSPDYSPYASSPTHIARYIFVGNRSIDPRTVYDRSISSFVLSLKSAGQPIEILFNFDYSGNLYAVSVLSSVGTLYALVIAPFVLVFIYTLARRTRRKRSHRLS